MKPYQLYRDDKTQNIIDSKDKTVALKQCKGIFTQGIFTQGCIFISQIMRE